MSPSKDGCGIYLILGVTLVSSFIFLHIRLLEIWESEEEKGKREAKRKEKKNKKEKMKKNKHKITKEN